MKNYLHKVLLLILFVSAFHSKSFSQIITISAVYTPAANSAGASSTNMGITFGIQNTNTTPIFLRGIDYHSYAGTFNWQLWYHPTNLTGNPGPITVANGWILITGPTNVTAAAAGITNIFSGMNFQIPASTTYRFALVTSNTQISYGQAGITPNIFSAAGVNLLVGDYNTNIGWASPWDWTTWAFQPRFYNGNIKIEANPCNNPPNPGTATATPEIVCANENLDLDLINNSTGTGQTYEWEFSTNNISFNSIGPASGNSDLTYAPSQSGYYRCKVTCGNGNPVYSTSIFVKVNSPVIYGVTDTTVCGGGFITLTADVDTGVLVKWYDNINSNTPIFTGNPFITPNIITTTTYYVEASNMDHSCPSARMPSTVTVTPAPSKPFGNDYSVCIDSGKVEFVDALNPGSLYLWDNAYQGRVRTITQSGTYHVAITNDLGCTTYDTITITLNKNPKSALGNDTSVCIGTEVSLNAGNTGIQYYWNNGANTNTISTKIPGQYYVNIIGANGCITIDTINIEHNGEAPKLDGIHIQNLASHTFKFNALNPQYIIGYEWDFGDGSANSYLNSPTHQYSNIGNYLVQVNVSSTCGITMDTMTVHIYTGTSIDEINGEKMIILHPNPAFDHLNITSTKDIIIQTINIYDIQGRSINNVPTKISDNKADIDIKQLPSGQYSIEIKTNKGILKDQFIKVQD